jgi:PKD repeat protein
MSFMTFEYDGSQKVENVQYMGKVNSPIMILKDPNDEIYVLSYKWGQSGKVFKLGFAGVNRPPTVTLLTSDKVQGGAPLHVTFAAEGRDPENQKLTYQWIFENGKGSKQQNPAHVFAKAGEYSVQVYVSDGVHEVASERLQIVVGAAPEVFILSPTDGSIFKARDTIQMIGTASVDKVNLPPDALSWEIGFIHDEHAHPVGSETFGNSASFVVPHAGHTYGGNVGLRFKLSATGIDGITTSSITEIWPDQVDQTFDTVPSGGIIVLDYVERETPFSIVTIPGFEHRITFAQERCTDEGLRQTLVSAPFGLNEETSIYVVTDVANDFIVKYSSPDGTVCDATDITTDGLVFRLDAASAVATNVGSFVTGWGPFNNINGAPTLVHTDSWKAGPTAYISFDGPRDGLSTTLVPAEMPSGQENRTVFAVVRYTSAEGQGRQAREADEGSHPGFGWGSICVDDDHSSKTSDAWFTGGVQATNEVVTDSCMRSAAVSAAVHPPLDGWYIQSSVLENGKITLFRNGIAVGDANSTDVSTSIEILWLGVRLGDVASSTVLDVAEVLVFNRVLSASELMTTNSRLYEKHILQSQAADDLQPSANHNRCTLVDDEKTAILECDYGFAISNVNFASYGVPFDYDLACPVISRKKGPCHAESSISVVSQHCVGKQKCELEVSPDFFGEGCNGYFKSMSGYTFEPIDYKGACLTDGAREDPVETVEEVETIDGCFDLCKQIDACLGVEYNFVQEKCSIFDHEVVKAKKSGAKNICYKRVGKPMPGKTTRTLIADVTCSEAEWATSTQASATTKTPTTITSQTTTVSATTTPTTTTSQTTTISVTATPTTTTKAPITTDNAISTTTRLNEKAEPVPVLDPSRSMQSCSDLAESGFDFSEASDTVCGASVIGGSCFKKIKFANADMACKNLGARLCTVRELKDEVGNTRGCRLQWKKTWASDGDCVDPATSPAAMSVAVKRSSEPRTKCKRAKSKNALRCCADKIGNIEKMGGTTAVAKPTSSISCTALVADEAFEYPASGEIAVCGATEVDGTCYKGLARHEQAVEICASVGARMCTSAEIKGGVGADTGCKVRVRTWIWAAATGHPDCVGDRALAQRPDPTESPRCKPTTTRLTVRCCGDTLEKNVTKIVTDMLSSGESASKSLSSAGQIAVGGLAGIVLVVISVLAVLRRTNAAYEVSGSDSGSKSTAETLDSSEPSEPDVSMRRVSGVFGPTTGRTPKRGSATTSMLDTSLRSSGCPSEV